MADDVLLSIRNLTIPLPKDLDREFAVENISYDLKAGEILCVVGESGSGKSMTANAVMGLLPSYLQPSGGQILFHGDDLLKMSPAALRNLRGQRIGMIFQEPLSALNPLMTVGDQIDEVMMVHGQGDRTARAARVIELLDFVGLPDPESLRHSYPFRLSGGQRQRVMIAMALALEPEILIADEPTTALDVTTQKQILDLIARIQREKGMGVMFITHDFGVVAEISDRVVVMQHGQIVEQGTADQVLNAPAHPYTQRLIAAVPHRDGSSLEGVNQDVEPILSARGLHKTYRSGGGLFSRPRIVEAVKNISFDLYRGETLGVVGESGSGKSTLGRCITKLEQVDSGQLLFRGEDILPLSAAAFRPYRQHLQMIFQDPYASLNPRQTIGRILTDGPVANGTPRREAEIRARELLALVGLEPSAHDRYPGEFSGGQRQRVGVARALMLNPDVIVADESVSALDVSVQAQVLALLRELQQKLNLGIIFITHDLRVAAQVCNRIIVMLKGEVVEEGPPEQVIDNPQHPYTQRLIAAIPGADWDPRAGVPPEVTAAAISPDAPAL